MNRTFSYSFSAVGSSLSTDYSADTKSMSVYWIQYGRRGRGGGGGEGKETLHNMPFIIIIKNVLAQLSFSPTLMMESTWRPLENNFNHLISLWRFLKGSATDELPFLMLQMPCQSHLSHLEVSIPASLLKSSLSERRGMIIKDVFVKLLKWKNCTVWLPRHDSWRVEK